MDRRAPIRARRSLKRKLENDLEETRKSRRACAQSNEDDLPISVRAHVELLASTDRGSANRASHFLSQLAKDEEMVDLIVDCGAIPLLVKHLEALPGGAEAPIPYEHEVEKWSALALGLLAIKPEHQRSIVDAGALPHLVHLLKRHNETARAENRGVNGVVRRAADAITNLAHENGSIKTLVRIEGGIPPLLELLASADVKVQRAAAAALRTLAFKNDENKNQIVECNALPTLVLMLRSEETSVQHEAVGVIGNLVHSSPDIKKEVLQTGVLQPIIRLLSSPCSESQRESALLLGQFAAGDTDCKVQIVQRGAIRPLIDMLGSQDSQLSEMAAFALGRLAQETNNQAGIAFVGGMVPLLKLLESKNEFLQHNAAFALYGLVDNEDNVADFIKVGGFQKLQDGVFRAQPTKDCVGRTLKRLEERTSGGVLNYLLYLMRVSEKAVQRTIALSLAHLCSPDDRKTIFLDNNGLELLLDLLESGSPRQHTDSSIALFNLATKVKLVSPVVAAPPSPTPQVYLDEKYVNNPTLSDVTFLVEGERFYAHRICLLASSDAFRAMFDGGYKERDATDVEIPNIRWQVFELMMRYIYTGSVEVSMDIAQELLIAADQYLLEGLKRLCEYTIAKDVCKNNISLMYELAEGFNAVSLKEACILFLLEKSAELSAKPWYPEFIQRILPEIGSYFTKACSKPTEE